MSKKKSIFDKLNSNDNLDPAYKVIIAEIDRQIQTFDAFHRYNQIKLYQDIRDTMTNRLKALGED